MPIHIILRRLFTLFIVGVIILLFTSCATIVDGVHTNIIINGQSEEPITITTCEQTYPDQQLPTTINIHREHLDSIISFTATNQQYASIIPGKQFNPNSHWNLISFPMGYIIDLATHASYKPILNEYYLTPVTTPMVINYNKNREKRPIPHLYRHEIGLSFLGVSSNNSSNRNVDNLTESMNARYHMEYDAECGFPGGFSQSIRYFYHLNHWLAVGANIGYAHDSESFSINRLEDRENLFGTTDVSTWYFMPSVKYNWYNHDFYSFYSSVSLGAYQSHLKYDLYVPEWAEEIVERADRHQRRDYWKFASQIDFLGFELGRRLRFFTELGYGIEGIWKLGFSFRFCRM